jgi:hypothetical protein
VATKKVVKKTDPVLAAAKAAHDAFVKLGIEMRPSNKEENRKAFYQAMLKLGEVLDG